VNLSDLFNDPRYRKPLAIGGVAAVAGLALVMKKRTAAAGAKSSAPSGSWLSAAPPPDAPVDTNAAALGSALAGLAQASANLQDVANNVHANAAASGAPIPGSGAPSGTGGGALSPVATQVSQSLQEISYGTWQAGRGGLPQRLNPLAGWGAWSTLTPEQQQHATSFLGGADPSSWAPSYGR
jgi:hypothetical protein